MRAPWPRASCPVAGTDDALVTAGAGHGGSNAEFNFGAEVLDVTLEVSHPDSDKGAPPRRGHLSCPDSDEGAARYAGSMQPEGSESPPHSARTRIPPPAGRTAAGRSAAGAGLLVRGSRRTPSPARAPAVNPIRP
jgi:hypothetical protein